MATRPKVLLLDEPAAGVPREDSAELFRAIAGLSREITVLFIEHDMEGWVEAKRPGTPAAAAAQDAEVKDDAGE